MQTHFVTGGSGFVGKYLVSALLEKGDEIWLLMRPQTKNSKAITGFIDNLKAKHKERLKVCEGDIAFPGLGLAPHVVLELLNKNIFFWHLAANLSFGQSEKESVLSVNINGTRNMVEFANMMRGKFIFMSTAYVWGDHTGVNRETEVYEKPKHRNTYELSKYEAEKIVLKNSQLPYLILRPSIIIGHAYEGKAIGCTFGYYRYTFMYHFLKSHIKRKLTKENLAGKLFRWLGTKYDEKNKSLEAPWLILPAPKDCGIDLVPIDYVIESAIYLSEHKQSSNKIFHLTNPHPPDYTFLVKALIEDLGLSKVKVVKIHPLLFNLLFRTAALLPGKYRKYFRSISWYLPYITINYRFDRTNVEKFSPVSFPELDRERMKHINTYARKTIYDSIGMC